MMAAAAMQAMSTIAGGQAQAAAGRANQDAMKYQASLRDAQASAMEQSAGQERAASQRGAVEQRRQGRLVGSRAQAFAAASGGGALDPTVVNLLGDLGNEADFRAATALYQGEDAARGREYSAVLQRAAGQGDLYAGEVARQAGINARNRSYLSAAGGIVGSAGKLYNAYTPTNTLFETASQRNLGRYALENPFDIYGGGVSNYYG